MSGLVFVVVVLCVYMLTAFLLKHYALKGLVCTRAFSRPAFFEGEEGEMIEVVRNDRPMIIPWLRVESGVSPHIRFGRQENLDVSDRTHTCSLFSLMPYQQIRRRHRVAFLRRGEYDLGSASLTAGDLLGLSEVHRHQDMRVPVLVYPRLLEGEDMPAPLMRLMNETVTRRQLLSDPFLFRGIRPYQFGDPVRDIHWPATARTGEAQIRLHDHTARTQLLVIINAQLREDQWGDRLMDYEEDAIERLISMAATLCMQALSSGCSAGFAANMPLAKDGPSAMLAPLAGPAAGEQLLASFARLRLVRTLRFATFLEQLPDFRDLDVIILSCYDSGDIRRFMEELRRRGNQAELYLAGKEAV
ncbi:MAG: DUF58 domain-containing protein [Clostridia bacterium]|nr:DUF58 domain-containing protein [Clostridia bacterium]